MAGLQPVLSGAKSPDWLPAPPEETHLNPQPVRVGDLVLDRVSIAAGATEGAHFRSAEFAPILILALDGRIEVGHGDLAVRLDPGTWTLSRGRVFVHAEIRAELLVVTLGSDFALRGASELRPHLLQRYGDASGAGAILQFHLMGLESLRNGEFNASSGPELAAITAHLLRVALMESAAVTPLANMRDALRMRIRTFVERNLHDPRLSIESIAARFNCSKRNLHKVFRDDSATLNKFLWSARLDRCRLELLDPNLRHRTITQIAFAWGFNNSAHFSRAFRARFGVTPRTLRDP